MTAIYGKGCGLVVAQDIDGTGSEAVDRVTQRLRGYCQRSGSYKPLVKDQETFSKIDMQKIDIYWQDQRSS